MRLPVLLLILAGPAAGADRRLDVDLEPVLETLYALRELAKPPDAPAAGAETPAAVRESLAALRAHPAVEKDAALDRTAFTTMARHELLTRLSVPVQGGLEPHMETEFARAAGGPERLQAWLDAVSDFYRRPELQAHLERRRRRMAGELARVRAATARIDYLRIYERYTGLVFRGTQHVRLSPFEFEELASTFCLVLKLEDGSFRLLNVIHPERMMPVDPMPCGSWPIWHELGHAVLDAAADFYAEELDARAANLADARATGACMMSWRNCVKENVNDAVAARLLELTYGAQTLADAEPSIAKRSPFVRALIDRLARFEAARAPGAAVTDAYPSLLDAFAPGADAAAAAELRERETIKDALFAWGDAERRERLALLDRVLARSPSPDRQVLAAALGCLTGQHARCERDAARALAARPRDASAAVLHAAALRARGRTGGAAAAYAKARELCVDSSPSDQVGCLISWPESLLPPAERWLQRSSVRGS